MSKSKKSEKNQIEEFYKMPIGIAISALQNYLFLNQEMQKSYPEDKDLPEEFEKISKCLKDFVEKFENGTYFEKFYIDDNNLVCEILFDMDKDSRSDFLQAMAKYIQILENLKDDKNINNANLKNEAEQIMDVYNYVAPFFYEVKFDNQYKKLLKTIFNDAINFSESCISHPNNAEELEFGYEHKNKSLIFRTKLRSLQSKSNEIQYVFNFVDSLSKEERDYFTKEHLQAFIDRCEFDLHREETRLENEFELMALAKQTLRILEKHTTKEN